MVDLGDPELGGQLVFMRLVGGEKGLVGDDGFVQPVQQEQVLGVKKAYVRDEPVLGVGGEKPLGCLAARLELLELVLADCLLAEYFRHLAVITAL